MGLLKFLCKEDIKTKLFTIGHLSMMPSLLNVSPLPSIHVPILGCSEPPSVGQIDASIMDECMVTILIAAQVTLKTFRKVTQTSKMVM